MLKASAILSPILFLSLAVFGATESRAQQTVQILSVFDDTPPSKECDEYFDGFPVAMADVRPCYVGSPLGDPRDTPTNWGLAHNNPRFHLTITGPAFVVAWFDQDAFLNTPFTLAKYGPPTSAGFRIGIGVNSTTVPCSGPGAFSPGAAADNSQAQNSDAKTAKCNGFVPAGQTITLYPLTAQRDGVAFFSGFGESVLTALVFPQ